MYASKLERRSRCFAHQFQSLPCFDATEPKLEMTFVPSLLMMSGTCACAEAAATVSRRMAARRMWSGNRSTLLPRPPIGVANAVLGHGGCECDVEIDVERVRHADGDENEIAQFFGDVAFRFATLRLFEPCFVTERTRELA